MSAAASRWISQRTATLSDLCRRTQIAGTYSSRSTSKTAWRQPMSPTLSSSSRRWWQRQTAWNSRIYAPREPARLFFSRTGQPRQFGTATQPQRQDTKGHLYLVLDGLEGGFSIHKVDMDNDLDDAGSTSAETPLLLPEPPVARLQRPIVTSRAQIAAIGSHIIAIHGRPGRVGAGPGDTIVFDTKSGDLLVSHALPFDLQYGYEAAIAGRDRLYVFESSTDAPSTDDDNPDSFCGGLHCLAAGPCEDEIHWHWQPLSSDSHFVWSWSDRPPYFPFDPKTITGHVVHPNTDAILVSADAYRRRGTFCYDIGGGGQWKFLGDWLLPFKGHGHYDKELDAWVGVHLQSFDTGDADGYLCACSVDMSPPSQQPNWKVSKEMLFLKHPHRRHVDADWSHVDAKLVYMGEHSKYCLVERLIPWGAAKMTKAGKLKYVLRVTTFIVQYDEHGALKIIAHQPARFYKAPSYSFRSDIQAFWM
ncbi:unnamed protein product [Alopecurus aequalis]